MTTVEHPITHEEPALEGGAPPPRRRRRRLSTGHLVMIVAALVAGLLNYAVLRARDDSVPVAVAAVALDAGEVMRASDVRFVDVRAEPALLATLVSSDAVGQIDGSVLGTPLAEGDLVRRGDLQAPSAPSAQRAMSIPVDPEHAVAGALEPGDRVDVIEVDGRSASYLVTDAQVLAVPDGQPTGIAGGLGAFSVTVAVDDVTALRIAVAIRSGQLELVRSTGAAQIGTERVAAPDAGGAEGDPGGPDRG